MEGLSASGDIPLTCWWSQLALPHLRYDSTIEAEKVVEAVES